MKRLAAISIPLFLAFTVAVRAEDTLYSDMGGQPGIDKIADVSVDNHLADPRIKDIFSQFKHRPHLRRIEGPVLHHLAGGPCRYTGHSTWRPRTRACT